MGIIYSLEWAQEVFFSFHGGHARATDLVMHYLGMTEIDVVDLLRKPGDSWNRFKEVVKLLDKYLTRPMNALAQGRFEALCLESALRYAVKAGWIRNKKHLDKAKSCGTLLLVPNVEPLREVTTEGVQLLLELSC